MLQQVTRELDTLDSAVMSGVTGSHGQEATGGFSCGSASDTPQLGFADTSNMLCAAATDTVIIEAT